VYPASGVYSERSRLSLFIAIHAVEGQHPISHDICYRTRLSRFGGHGYGHIFANVVPLMRRRGFSAAEIEQITIGTPRRLLTFV
jgi:phosphotriesterase-related protein